MVQTNNCQEERHVRFSNGLGLRIGDVDANLNSIEAACYRVGRTARNHIEALGNTLATHVEALERVAVNGVRVLFEGRVLLQEFPFHCWYFDHAMMGNLETTSEQLKARFFALGAFCEGLLRLVIESVSYLSHKILENCTPSEEDREAERVSLSKREAIIQEQKKGVLLSAKAIISPTWAKTSGEEAGVGVAIPNWNFGTLYLGDRSSAVWRFEASYYGASREA